MAQPINKKVLLFVLLLGGFLSILNQTLLNVALSKFMEVFDVGATTVQWLATGFMLVNGILIPVTAFLMKRFSTRQLFISSMLLLLVGSIICAIVTKFCNIINRTYDSSCWCWYYYAAHDECRYVYFPT
jgi:MFS family permease